MRRHLAWAGSGDALNQCTALPASYCVQEHALQGAPVNPGEGPIPHDGKIREELNLASGRQDGDRARDARINTNYEAHTGLLGGAGGESGQLV